MKDTLRFNDPGPPGQVEVEIRYHYTPPDPVTLGQLCGYEPPGATAAVELTGVQAVRWTFNGTTANRNDHWIWLVLDAYAFALVLRDWDHYHALALQQSVLEN